MLCSPGGPPFVAPLRAAGALEAILENISPSTNSPQTVRDSLRALAVLVDAATSTASDSVSDLHALADSLFVPAHIESMQTILLSSSPDNITQSQINLVAHLIAALCEEDNHRYALAKPNGILDALATRLASFAVAEGLVIPGAERLLGDDGSQQIPDPAPRSAKLAPILGAIGAIVAHSKYSSYVLLTSPALLSIFPPPAAVRDLWRPRAMPNRDENSSAMEYLLPAIPQQRTSRRSQQKPAETREDKSIPGTSVQGSLAQSNGRAEEGTSEIDEPESPLIPYLIHLSRTSDDDMVRLLAIAVLQPLVKAGFATKPGRESTLALLVVPTLLQLIRDHLNRQRPNESSPSVNQSTKDSWAILEYAPELLCGLILDNETLQRAAFECDATETLAKLLQEAYSPVVATQPKMWSAQGNTTMEADEGPASCRLGPAGILPLLSHRIRLRERVLKALHALAATEEQRKAIVDFDTMPYIAESLAQYPGKPLPAKERQVDNPFEVVNPAYGENPSSVIVAACHMVRMLSRSVGLLRTALVDYGVWSPILHFLRHPDVDVQIAAAGVMVNLVTETSPMREVFESPPVYLHLKTSQLTPDVALVGSAHHEDPVCTHSFVKCSATIERVMGSEARRHHGVPRLKKVVCRGTGAWAAGSPPLRRH